MSENRIKCEDYLTTHAFEEPITEQSNILTTNIDLAESGHQILSILAQTDLEILNGWKLNETLTTDGLKYDESIQKKLLKLAQLIAENIEKKNLMLILSGCGTSGRLAYLYSQKLNEYFQSKVADYILAGGDYALVNSVEAIEDRPDIGCNQLKSKLDQYTNKKIVYVGITCGLSAPFVAGQLDYLLKENDSNLSACVLIGFNSTRMARKNIKINEANETFYDLAQRMVQLETIQPNKFFILNPLIGPEPITGSTRMKSGSATKILLDLILSYAIQLAQNDDSNLLDQSTMFNYYQNLISNVIYSKENLDKLGKLIDRGAACLRNNGSINYVCAEERLGLLCCVDASECLPTFGAKPKDIRGFVTNRQLTKATGNYDSSSNQLGVWSGFNENCTETCFSYILNHLENEFSSKHYMFLVIDAGKNTSELDKSLGKPSNPSEIFHLHVKSDFENDTANDSSQHFSLNGLKELLNDSEHKVNKFFAQCMEEMSVKLIVNAVSTGAHILIGKTYENLMIDVRVSNFKLYNRAISIIQKLSTTQKSTSMIDKEECEAYLLKSIYKNKELPVAHRNSIQAHIEIATCQDQIVPKALIMLLAKVNAAEAERLLNDANGSVRNCIFNLKRQNKIYLD